MIVKLRKYFFRKFFRKDIKMVLSIERHRIWQLLGEKSEIMVVRGAEGKKEVLSIDTATLELIVFPGQ